MNLGKAWQPVALPLACSLNSTVINTCMSYWNLPVTTHGRVAIDQNGNGSGPIDTLVLGFHGYTGNADHALAMAASLKLRGSSVCLGVQGLHRFYKAGTIAASWMTSEDREDAITDNLNYLDQVLQRANETWSWQRIILCGFSQGAAMAFRGAAHLAKQPIPVYAIAVGGDIPPDVHQNLNKDYPPTLLIRGTSDRIYTEEKFSADRSIIAKHEAPITATSVDTHHTWDDAIASVARSFINNQIEYTSR